jgi:hypothetical protein
MTRAFAALVLGAALFAGTVLLDRATEALASTDEPLVLSLGDRFRLEGADVGCRVTRLTGHGKRVFLDCRRAGRAQGTYGVYYGEESLLVVRFVDARAARVVFRARHGGTAGSCR